jgi:hypothetical protein
MVHGSGINQLLLRRRVGGFAAVVGRIEPPCSGEEGGPDGGKDVVGEEEVGKVEAALGIFLQWRLGAI